MPAQAVDPCRVVLYGRVSRLKRGGTSVDEQLDWLREHHTAAGHVIVDTLRDDGIGVSRHSRKKERGDWERAMELVTTGATDGLAVWETSRATRLMDLHVALQAACAAAGVVIFERGRRLDPRDATDALTMNIRAATNQFEVDQLRDRVKRNMDSRVSKGEPHGRVPFGYRRIRDMESGRVLGREEHPERGPIIREVVRRLIAGESGHSIAADLNERGVPTSLGGRWTGGNLIKMVAAPCYRGLREHHGETIHVAEPAWPPLVTEEQHMALRKLLEDPNRDRWRHSTVVQHLGSGIYGCGREGCDGFMRIVHQSDGRPLQYGCGRCFKCQRNQEAVDQLVGELVIGYLSRPNIRAELAELENDPGIAEAVADVDRLTAELADWQDYARQRREQGKPLSAARYNEQADDIENRLAAAERRALPKTLPPEVWAVAGPEAEAQWKAAPVTVKRIIVRALFDVVIMPAGRGKRIFDSNLIKVTWRGVQ